MMCIHLKKIFCVLGLLVGVVISAYANNYMQQPNLINSTDTAMVQDDDVEEIEDVNFLRHGFLRAIDGEDIITIQQMYREYPVLIDLEWSTHEHEYILTPLTYAIIFGKQCSVATLLDLGMDPDVTIDDVYPICMTVDIDDQQKKQNIIRLLLHKSREKKHVKLVFFDTLLFAQDVENIKNLIAVVPSIIHEKFECDEGSFTLLELALFEQKLDVIKVLVEAGFDFNQSFTYNDQELTPLQYAIEQENEQLISLLIGLGANVDRKTVILAQEKELSLAIVFDLRMRCKGFEEKDDVSFDFASMGQAGSRKRKATQEIKMPHGMPWPSILKKPKK